MSWCRLQAASYGRGSHVLWEMRLNCQRKSGNYGKRVVVEEKRNPYGLLKLSCNCTIVLVHWQSCHLSEKLFFPAVKMTCFKETNTLVCSKNPPWAAPASYSHVRWLMLSTEKWQMSSNNLLTFFFLRGQEGQRRRAKKGKWAKRKTVEHEERLRS